MFVGSSLLEATRYVSLLEVDVVVGGYEGAEDHDGHARDDQVGRRLLKEPVVPRDNDDIRQVLEHGHLQLEQTHIARINIYKNASLNKYEVNKHPG